MVRTLAMAAVSGAVAAVLACPAAASAAPASADSKPTDIVGFAASANPVAYQQPGDLHG